MDGEPLDLVGDILGDHFRVDEFAGEGLLSVVYKGRHLSVDATVAIKCLNLPPTLDAALARPIVDNFQEGCRLHYQLARGNLNIAQTIASGTTIAPRTGASVPYLVREWFEGESLGRHLSRRREKRQTGRSLAETMRLLGGLADGLAYAHEQKIAHLSVHPSNVFLVRVGESCGSKVLDFGVGSAVDAAAAGVRPNLGAQILFPAYAAPEQLHRLLGETGPWTDVYALALMVLETLSDRAVIEDLEVKATVDRVLDPKSRPSAHGHGVQVSDAVERVFERAFALDPNERYADARGFWTALKAASADVLRIVPPFAAKKKKNPTVLQRLRERRKPFEGSVIPPALQPSMPPAAEALRSDGNVSKTAPSPEMPAPAKAPAARPPPTTAAPAVQSKPAVPAKMDSVSKVAKAPEAKPGTAPHKAPSISKIAAAKNPSVGKMAAAKAKPEFDPAAPAAKIDAATKADGIAEALAAAPVRDGAKLASASPPTVKAAVPATEAPEATAAPEATTEPRPPKIEKRPSITEVRPVPERAVAEVPKTKQLHMRRSSRPPAFAAPRRNAPPLPKPPENDLTTRKLGVAPLPADLMASIPQASLAPSREASEAMAAALEAALPPPRQVDASPTVPAPPMMEPDGPPSSTAIDDGWEEEPAPITPSISAASEARLVAAISMAPEPPAPAAAPPLPASRTLPPEEEPIVADLISDPPMPLFPGAASSEPAVLVMPVPPARMPMVTSPALGYEALPAVSPRRKGPLYGVVAFSAAIALGILALVVVRLTSGGGPAPVGSATVLGGRPTPPPSAVPSAVPSPALTLVALPPSASVRVNTSGTHKPFNPYKAKLALDKVAKDLRSCRTADGLWGTGGATVYFANDGTVDHIALGPPYRGAPAGTCVTDRLKTAEAPPFDGPPQPVIYMFMVPMKVPAP
jgi:eukaryotic-like serine/threonine-protein kinase